MKKSKGGWWLLNRSICAVNSVALGSAPTTSYLMPCLSSTGSRTSRPLWPPSVFSNMTATFLNPAAAIQPPRRSSAFLRLAAGVDEDHLNRPSEHAALGIEFVGRDLGGLLHERALGIAARRRERANPADLDRIRRPGRCANELRRRDDNRADQHEEFARDMPASCDAHCRPPFSTCVQSARRPSVLPIENAGTIPRISCTQTGFVRQQCAVKRVPLGVVAMRYKRQGGAQAVGGVDARLLSGNDPSAHSISVVYQSRRVIANRGRAALVEDEVLSRARTTPSCPA